MTNISDHETTTLFYYRGGKLMPGGVETMIARQAKWLMTNSSIRPTVIVHHNNQELAEFFVQQHIQVHFIPESHLGSIFRISEYISMLIKETNGRCILQSHLFRESIICRLVKLRSKYLKHLFRAETYIDCSEISWFKKMIYHSVDYITQSGVSLYVANGNLVAKEIVQRSYINTRKVVTVYNGCERFGMYDDKPVSIPLRMAMVANLLPVKNHLTLLKALQICRKEGIEINVDLFGTEIDKMPYDNFPSYKDYLDEKIAETETKDLVAFRGFSKRLAEDLNEYQIIILTSKSEGTANAIQEAMSVGKLIICSAVYELPYVLDSGNCGLLFPAGDHFQLAELIKNIAINPTDQRWTKMRANAAKRWETHFNTTTMMNQMRNLYLEEKT